MIDGNLDGGRILYYENDKKNAIATKITGKAKTAVETQVNTTVFATITELAAKLGSTLENTDNHAAVHQMTVRMENLKKDIKGLQHMLGSTKKMTDAVMQTMKGMIQLNEKIILDLRSDLGFIATASVSFSTSGIETANVRLQDYLLLMKDGKADLTKMRKELKGLYEHVDELESDLIGIKDSELLQQMVDVLENEPEKIGTFFSTPVNLQKERVYPIKNYGSQMAPFYTVLSIWVGALILVAIIHTKVHPIKYEILSGIFWQIRSIFYGWAVTDAYLCAWRCFFSEYTMPAFVSVLVCICTCKLCFYVIDLFAYLCIWQCGGSIGGCNYGHSGGWSRRDISKRGITGYLSADLYVPSVSICDGCVEGSSWRYLRECISGEFRKAGCFSACITCHRISV